MQTAITWISGHMVRPTAPTRPQPDLDPETYDAVSGIVLGVCFGAVIWIGIFYVIYALSSLL